MPELLLYFSTAACWLVLSGLAWRASRPALAGGPMPVRAEVRPEGLITPVALEKGLRFAIREGGRTVGAGTVAEIVE